jgi:hypothetical protein
MSLGIRTQTITLFVHLAGRHQPSFEVSVPRRSQTAANSITVTSSLRNISALRQSPDDGSTALQKEHTSWLCLESNRPQVSHRLLTSPQIQDRSTSKSLAKNHKRNQFMKITCTYKTVIMRVRIQRGPTNPPSSTGS